MSRLVSSVMSFGFLNSIIGGLISSTILTLVVVPVVHVLLDNLASKFSRKKE